MQLDANIDESDVGQIASGQHVSFHVDAYPTETFPGPCRRSASIAATLNNVVTYMAIIDAPNHASKLKPGMTATATIEVARRDDVLRVPTAALRFTPDAAVLAAYVGARDSADPSGTTRTVWVMNGATIAPVTVTAGDLRRGLAPKSADRSRQERWS